MEMAKEMEIAREMEMAKKMEMAREMEMAGKMDCHLSYPAYFSLLSTFKSKEDDLLRCKIHTYTLTHLVKS